MKKVFSFFLSLSALALSLHARSAEASSLRTFLLALNSSAVGKIVDLRGTVKISRSHLRKPIVARRNIQLIAGDKLIIDTSSAAKVICFSGFEVLNLEAGEHINICQPTDQVRDTFTNTLNLGAVEIVRRPDGTIILRPKANDYREILALIVNARPEYLGSSISLKELLPNDKRNELEDRIRQLQSISEDERRLLRADVYAMNKLYEDAIDELKHVSNAASDPSIQINLGDLYLARNISGDAKRAYTTAIQAAVVANDDFSEALAQHALGMIYKFEGGKAFEACRALTRAIQLYSDIGESRTADLLQSELKALSPAEASLKPSISSISPSTAASGGMRFTLVVNGTRFIPDSVINWNGVAHTTTFVSSTQLKADINAADLSSPGIVNITVTNPPPCGGASNPQTLTIQNAPGNPPKDK